MKNYILDEQQSILITVTGQQIRQYEDIFYQTKLSHVFDMAAFKVDFLRQLVGQRSEEEIEVLEMEILTHIALCEARMETYPQRLFFVPFDSMDTLLNEINYIKYCKVNNRRLIDKLPSIEEYYINHDKYTEIDKDKLNLNLPKDYQNWVVNE